MMPGPLQRFLNDCWRKTHGWKVQRIDGVKTWVRR